MSSVLVKQDILNAYHVIFGPVAGAPIDILSYLNPMALKTAYRKKAFETHPDRSLIIGEMEGKMTERFVELTLAYETMQSALKGFRPNGEGYDDRLQRKCRERTVNTFNRNDVGNFFYNGRLPKRKLLIGQFLYYSGMISWKRLIEAISWQKMQRPQIGQIALKWGILSEDDIRAILKQRSLERNFDKRFGEYAWFKGYITSFELLALLGKQRMLQRPIGEYFVEKGIIPAGNMDRIIEKLQVHNRSAFGNI